MEKVVCPRCGSEKIMAMRGEVFMQSQAHECCCHECDCFFLVSQMLSDTPRK